MKKVALIMGSKTDYKILKEAELCLKEFGLKVHVEVVSAHRTPDLLFEYAASAAGRGLKVIIAGAGGSAHLPGVIAAITTLPVIGVPIKSSNSIGGLDSLFSIVSGL